MEFTAVLNTLESDRPSMVSCSVRRRREGERTEYPGSSVSRAGACRAGWVSVLLLEPLRNAAPTTRPTPGETRTWSPEPSRTSRHTCVCQGGRFSYDSTSAM